MGKRGPKKKYFIKSRDFQDPQYIEWRAYIRTRDKWKCQMPLCGKVGQHCHHIQKWAVYPALRYDKNNGVFLCAACHKQIRGQEELYSALFMQIVWKNTMVYNEKKRKKNG